MSRFGLSLCSSVLLLIAPLAAAAQQTGTSGFGSTLNARELPPAPGASFNLGDARRLFLSELPPRPNPDYRAPVRAQGRAQGRALGRTQVSSASTATGEMLGGLKAVGGASTTQSDVPLGDVPLGDVPLGDVPLGDIPLGDIAPSAAPLSPDPSAAPIEIDAATLGRDAIDDSGTIPIDQAAPAQEPGFEDESLGDEDFSDEGFSDEGFSDEDFGNGDLSDEDLEDLFEETEGPEDDDPLEPVNRVIFDVNLTLDRWLLRPVTRAYIETVPEPGRDGLSNMLDNVASPVTLVNDLLQGEMSRAGATFGRFFINSVFGLGGFFDTAESLGLPGHTEDFGQTLGAYGVPGSPYLVLPILGPSSPRDAVGRGVDTFFDPSNFFAPDGLQSVQTGVSLVSDRASIINETDSLEATAVDFYAAIRSFYYQNREFEIANGRSGEEPFAAEDGEDPAVEEINLDLYDDLEEDEALDPAE